MQAHMPIVSCLMPCDISHVSTNKARWFSRTLFFFPLIHGEPPTVAPGPMKRILGLILVGFSASFSLDKTVEKCAPGERLTWIVITCDEIIAVHQTE